MTGAGGEASPLRDHFRKFALYNRWANGAIYAAAAKLSPDQLAADRGGYFKSVLGTLNHLLVTDGMWLDRLDGASPQGVRLDTVLHAELPALRDARRATDKRLIDLVYPYRETDFAVPFHYRTTAGSEFTQPLVEILAHVFNHQTHHRGQAHDLIGQMLGRDAVPVLDLVAYLRTAGANDAP